MAESLPSLKKAIIRTLWGNIYEMEYDGTEMERVRCLHAMDPIAFPWMEPFPQDYIRFVRIREEDIDTVTDVECYFALVYPTDTGVKLVKHLGDAVRFQMAFPCFQRIFTSETPETGEWLRSSTDEIDLSLLSADDQNESYAEKKLERFRTGWALSHTIVNQPHHVYRETPYTCFALTEDAKREILRLYLLHCPSE